MYTFDMSVQSILPSKTLFTLITNISIFFMLTLNLLMKSYDVVLQIKFVRIASLTLFTIVSKMFMYTFDMFLQIALVRKVFVTNITSVLDIPMNTFDMLRQFTLPRKVFSFAFFQWMLIEFYYCL